MSMDSSQLGLLLGVNVAQHEADSARPVGTRGSGDRPAAAGHPGPALRGPAARWRTPCTTSPTRSLPPAAPRRVTRPDDRLAPGTRPGDLPCPAWSGTGWRRVAGDAADDRRPGRRQPDDGVQRVLAPGPALGGACAARSSRPPSELGYVGPDPSARALARGTTGAVGVLLTESVGAAFRDPIAAAFFGAVAEELAPTGLAVVLLPSHGLGGHDPGARHPDGRRARLRVRGRLARGRLAGEAQAPPGVRRPASRSRVPRACCSTSSTARGLARPAPARPRAPPHRHPHHERRGPARRSRPTRRTAGSGLRRAGARDRLDEPLDAAGVTPVVMEVHDNMEPFVIEGARALLAHAGPPDRGAVLLGPHGARPSCTPPSELGLRVPAGRVGGRVRRLAARPPPAPRADHGPPGLRRQGTRRRRGTDLVDRPVPRRRRPGPAAAPDPGRPGGPRQHGPAAGLGVRRPDEGCCASWEVVVPLSAAHASRK